MATMASKTIAREAENNRQVCARGVPARARGPARHRLIQSGSARPEPTLVARAMTSPSTGNSFARTASGGELYEFSLNGGSSNKVNEA
jgi:hypothetical protein